MNSSSEGLHRTAVCALRCRARWVPAFAGMTEQGRECGYGGNDGGKDRGEGGKGRPQETPLHQAPPERFLGFARNDTSATSARLVSGFPALIPCSLHVGVPQSNHPDKE